MARADSPELRRRDPLRLNAVGRSATDRRRFLQLWHVPDKIMYDAVSDGHLSSGPFPAVTHAPLGQSRNSPSAGY